LEKSKLNRAIQIAVVKDSARQLSYVPKFATYHRPGEQAGPRKSQAKPLLAKAGADQ
jgi:hypothetical protein